MTRENPDSNRVALLATGDELSNGDIANTNAREIAQQLSARGITPGMQLVVSDHISEITDAIDYLLARHRGLIITGGLGPTSDDLTRFALSKALNEPLVFHQTAWDEIVARLRRYGHTTPPESNRQQALFPEQAILIPNASGTAAGCLVAPREKRIFMLPGPPAECMPMVSKVVIPALQEAGFHRILFRRHWLLFGVSEGKIAETLDAICAKSGCTTGYRISYPYVEFKLLSAQEAGFLAILPEVEKTVAPWLCGNGEQTASTLFRQTLSRQQVPLRICDEATGGTFESTVHHPETSQLLSFVSPEENPHVIIRGLEEFWSGQASAWTSVSLDFPVTGQPATETRIPLRGARVRLYATEFACRELARLLPIPGQNRLE